MEIARNTFRENQGIPDVPVKPAGSCASRRVLFDCQTLLERYLGHGIPAGIVHITRHHCSVASWPGISLLKECL